MQSPSEEKLRGWYETERLSTRAICRITGVSSPVVRKWMRAFGIQARSISEAKRGQKPAPHTVEASVKARRKHVLPGRPIVGYKINGDGYVMVWRSGRYVKEHREILEKKLGRRLLPQEDGHHKNEVRHDNDPENLELMPSRSEHQKHHSKTRKRVQGRFA